MDFDSLLQHELAVTAADASSNGGTASSPGSPPSSSSSSRGRKRQRNEPPQSKPRPRPRASAPLRALVIVPAGDASLHPAWLQRKTHGEDSVRIAVVYYGDNDAKAGEFRASADYFLQAKGAKWTLVRRALEELVPRWRTEFTHVWIPDDDLRFQDGDQAAALHRFLRIAHDERVKLCQPALVDNGNITPAYRHLLRVQPQNRLRWVNFVEIMAPCFATHALSRVFGSLERAQSGWGLDSVWPTLFNFRDIAVVDAVPVVHTRPPSAFRSGDGASFYSKLGIDPGREEFELLQRYAIRPFRKTTLGRIAAPLEDPAVGSEEAIESARVRDDTVALPDAEPSPASGKEGGKGA